MYELNCEILVVLTTVTSNGFALGFLSFSLRSFLLFFLRLWSSFNLRSRTSYISKRKVFEGSDVFLIFNENSNRLQIPNLVFLSYLYPGHSNCKCYLAHVDILGTSVNQDLGEETFLLTFKVHLCLICFDLYQNIAWLDFITHLLLPSTNGKRRLVMLARSNLIERKRTKFESTLSG